MIKSAGRYKRHNYRALWPLTASGTLAAAAMLAGTVLVILAIWRS